MSTLRGRKITETGIDENMSTANTGGDQFSNSGVEFVKIKNSHASDDYKVTFTPATTALKTALHGSSTKSNTVVTVTNGTVAYAGPFKQNVWNNSDNKVSITYGHASGSGSSEDTAIGSGSHLLKLEVLFLDPK